MFGTKEYSSVSPIAGPPSLCVFHSSSIENLILGLKNPAQSAASSTLFRSDSAENLNFGTKESTTVCQVVTQSKSSTFISFSLKQKIKFSGLKNPAQSAASSTLLHSG
jgi:hypothetical protein